jgi:hypothetical protein
MDELVTLRRSLERARQNGWQHGQDILLTINLGYPVDEEVIARNLCCTKEFAQAFWKDSPHPEKHLLGMELVESPLTYLALYVT